VDFTAVMSAYWQDPQRLETAFALRALMEIPEQYKVGVWLGGSRAAIHWQ
jgi:phosphoserine aminotransferase